MEHARELPSKFEEMLLFIKEQNMPFIYVQPKFEVHDAIGYNFERPAKKPRLS